MPAPSLSHPSSLLLSPSPGSPHLSTKASEKYNVAYPFEMAWVLRLGPLKTENRGLAGGQAEDFQLGPGSISEPWAMH